MLAAPALDTRDEQQHGERYGQQHDGNRRGGSDVVVLDLAENAHGGNFSLVRDVARDEDDRAELTDGTSEAKTNTGQDGGEQVRQHDQAKGRPVAGAERRRRLLHLPVELLQYRLDRPHDEGERDEEERQDYRDLGVGDVDAKRAAGAVEGDQRQTGHDRRQGEGQI